eukprot:Pgem_evm1s18643
MKMMEKMGWQQGEGLGKQKNGKTTHCKVKMKNNARGVGADRLMDDGWLDMQAGFNDLLANLTENHAT